MHISIPNTVFFVNGKLVQLDDALVIAAHQKSEDNVESVTVSLSVDGNYLNISTSASIKYLARYVLTLAHGDKTYDVDMSKSCTCSLSELTAKVPEGIYSASVRAESIFGKRSQPSNTENVNIFASCAPMTLRFQFSQEDYDPNVLKEGIWNKGDWTHRGDNVWDWTYDNNNWKNIFIGAFADSGNMVKIIDSGDTSMVTNFSSAFYNCSALTEVRSMDTRGATDTSNLFQSCYELAVIPVFYLDSVLHIDYMFNECYKLSHISLKNISNILTADYTFFRCRDLVSVKLDPVMKVSSMNGIFSGCSSIEKLPWMDTSNVTESKISAAFSYCTNLSEVPDYDTHNITMMSNVFAHCTNLKNIPHFDTSNVTMFTNCFTESGIETTPDWDFSAATQLTQDFVNCSNLKMIAPMNLENARVTAEMFRNCRNVESGAYDLYVYLSTKPVQLYGYGAMFMNCGADTESGREDLAKIPSNWGGTMQS